MKLPNFLFSEKFFLVLTISIAIFFNLFPYFYQLRINPPDRTYIGSFPIIYDKATYLSEMTQGEDGNWEIINKYTAEPQEKAPLYLLYTFLGRLAKFFGLSIETTFLIGRFATGIVLLFSVIYFIRYFVSDDLQRKMAYFFAFFASGLGWITRDISSLDLWIPDAVPIVRFSYFPHFMIANFLLLWTILLFYHSLKTSKIKYAAIAGFLSFVLNIVLPFSGVFLYSLIALFLAALFLKNRKIIIENLKHIAVFFGISLPSLVFMYYAGITNSVWSMVEKQNILPTPPPLSVITGYGLIFFFSLFGVYALYKKGGVKNLLFAIWILTVYISAYIPLSIYPMQRRALETGFYVPLAITASFGIIALYQYLKTKNIPDLRLKFISVFMMFGIPFLLAGNLQNWTQFKSFMEDFDNPKFYLPASSVDSMRWLRKNSPTDSVILSSFFSGNVIPYYADRYVYAGHGPMTINLSEKLGNIESFYSGTKTPEELLGFLQREKINYVFYSEIERQMGNFDPEKYTFLKKVYPTAKNSADEKTCMDEKNSHKIKTTQDDICNGAEVYQNDKTAVYKF